eukprot:COSAG01_NODE_6053_length_3878_cov_4.702831_1_plen_68_part_00
MIHDAPVSLFSETRFSEDFGSHRSFQQESSEFVHKGSASSANKISLGKYENSVCHVASTVAVKIDYR